MALLLCYVGHCFFLTESQTAIELERRQTRFGPMAFKLQDDESKLQGGTSKTSHSHGHQHSGLAINKDCLLENIPDWLGLETDVITYASLLRRCTKAKALSDGVRVHAHLTMGGYAGDRFLSNLLIQMYSKCGGLGYARAVFDKIVCRNVYSWTIMIAACAHNGHDKEALRLFGEMQAQGFQPDKITLTCVLDACAGVATLKKGQEVHTIVASNGWELDIVVGSTLINMYGKCGSLDDAKAVFAEMPLWDVVSWSAMMAACTQNGQGKEALQLFEEMQAKGFEPNKITFMCILDACANVAALEEGQEIHATVVGNGWESDVSAGITFVNMYGKCRSLNEARSVFAEMPLWDVISWNSMIAACAQNGHGKEALEVFAQMQAEGFDPDKITFVCVLDACASVEALEDIRQVHAIVAGNGLELDLVVGNTLINMYGKCGSLDDMRAVFAEMPLRDVVSWNALMAAYVHTGHGKEALLAFGQMQMDGFVPNKVTFICFLDACACVEALEEGREMHNTLAGKGWGSGVVAGTALINLYGKCGSLDDARAVFAEMPLWDVVSWNAMMVGYAQNGLGEAALQLFGQMQAEGFEPNRVTFICVLTACSHTGLVADGRRYFASMVRDHGIPPSLDHYVCMIDLLGRDGLLEEAEDLICSMPFERSSSAWLSLLSSCRIHIDMERAVRTASFVLELDVEPASLYALLVNNHARGGKPDNAEKLNEAMTEETAWP